MEKKQRLTKSQRKFIRREKSRIRRMVLDIEKQKEIINGLYQKFQNYHKETKKPKS